MTSETYPWPDYTDEQIGQIFRRLVTEPRSLHTKAGSIKMEHGNSYGACVGWEIEIQWAGKQIWYFDSTDLKKISDSEEWPQLWHVLEYALNAIKEKEENAGTV